jgi:NitT/TauT family transport system permease protein
VTPVLTLAIYQSVKYDVHDELINKAYTLGASHFEVIFEVVFMHVLPRIVESVRLQLGPAMVFLIAAEWAAGSVGVGYRLRMESRLMHMSVVYDYIALVAVFGYGVDRALYGLRRLCCPWFGNEK